MIRDLIYLAGAGKRHRARRASAQRWVVGFCVVTAAASAGVVTGILIAPKSGKETRADLKKGAKKAVASVEKAVVTVEKAIQGKTDDDE